MVYLFNPNFIYLQALKKSFKMCATEKNCIRTFPGICKNNFQRIIIVVFYLSFLSLSTISCREEVISPGNIIGVKNLGVKSNQRNYYTFKVEAENFTVFYLDSLRLYTYACLVNVKTTGYGSGEAKVEIISEEGNTLLTRTVSKNADLQFYYEGVSRPKWTSVRFNSFTGNLIFEIKKTF